MFTLAYYLVRISHDFTEILAKMKKDDNTWQRSKFCWWKYEKKQDKMFVSLQKWDKENFADGNQIHWLRIRRTDPHAVATELRHVLG